MATKSSLKPVGTLFADTWKLWTKHINALALIAVIPLIFAAAKMLLIPGFIIDYGYPLWLTIILLVAAAIFGLLHLIFVLVLPISVPIAVDEGQRGKTIEAHSVYAKAFSEVIQYIFVLMLVVIVVLGGSILFIIPGIIAGIYLKFAVFAYIFEDKRGMDALMMSAWYVRGNWWAIVWRNILLALILVFTGLLFAVLVGIVLISIGFGAPLFSILFQLFVFMILVPFALTYMYVLYKDAKSLKEGKAPEKSFVNESEQLFIILLIVAAVATLIFFFTASYSQWNVQIGAGSSNNGGAAYGSMMMRNHGGYSNY